MSSLGARNSLPLWMNSFLHTNFFYRGCANNDCPKGTQPNQCNMFCRKCIAGPFCRNCTDKHHGGHRLLQARKSSEYASVKTSDIKKYINTEGIRVFRINGDDIFFLKSRGLNSKLWGPISHGCCRTCNWKLDNGALYCSINCKLIKELRPNDMPPSISEGLEQHRKRSRPDESTSSRDIPDPSEPINFRKKDSRRKGIPHRAPFF